MLRSDLCDYNDTYIVEKERISVRGNNAAKRSQKLAFKNNALFTSCLSKINKTFVDNAEDFDIVMPMSSCQNIESLQNYYRDEINDDANENVNNNRIDNIKTITSKSFDYKTKIIGKTLYDNNTSDTEIIVPLKYLNNFWRSLDLPLTGKQNLT